MILGARPCPCCAILNAGKDEAACDHVTCYNCGFEYCYLCDAPRAPVMAHGNHYHLEKCKYYSAKGEEDGDDIYRPVYTEGMYAVRPCY